MQSLQALQGQLGVSSTCKMWVWVNKGGVGFNGPSYLYAEHVQDDFRINNIVVFPE